MLYKKLVKDKTIFRKINYVIRFYLLLVVGIFKVMHWPYINELGFILVIASITMLFGELIVSLYRKEELKNGYYFDSIINVIIVVSYFT